MREKYLNVMTALITITSLGFFLPTTTLAGTGLFDLGKCGSTFDKASCDSNCCDSSDYATGRCDSLACDGCCNAECDSFSNCCKQWDSLIGNLDCCGLIKHGDPCFNDFISPMVNFVFFEDPRTVSELRPVFVSHKVPTTIGNGVPAGGSIQLLAMQFRIALSERLSLIATKDGYIFDNTDNALDDLLDSGWADVSVGLKYNLLRDTCRGKLASVGATYEIPLGSDSALQSVGDGEFHFFLTAGQRILNGNGHLLSAVGYRLPADDKVQTAAIHWSNHIDLMLTDSLYLFTEVAWWHWTDDAANGAALGVAGQDLFNLSVSDVAGNNLVTQNVGVRYKPRTNVETGLAYEFPLTGFKDVIENRVMVDLILRY